jgi:hypothetical protein
LGIEEHVKGLHLLFIELDLKIGINISLDLQPPTFYYSGIGLREDMMGS